ncbi:RNA polymerase sigma-70 factor, ECF subfamily [Paenibacillus sophorae]|uniref:RNA polymerase sigma factor n=1 Tax=Paenibacillus sophorae TaxID=1333845 RepID=A0A1H8RAW6_9BACL|nr:RNA polymerase sigma factor [Paenibacillus sophorae]QWU15008.1 RNA polymerase sigma factor [Paenibacillus sophorae]SEO63284.1 RNA polymerase sigma-70 factor, ECF subfamily [Paenibacillus sophorae]
MDDRELFETYNRDVYRTCYYMVHNAADAEDLCQDVFIAAFRSRREELGNPKAWILKIAVNHCLNHLSRRRKLKLKVEDNRHLLAGDANKPVDRIVEDRETAGEWAVYLERLPVKIRAAITLRYMHDFSLSDISEMLSVPVGTAKSRLHKGLRLMKKMLEKEGHAEEEGNYEEAGRRAHASVK